ncbi:SRPBCC family protein [Williamsia deligens]|uniref:SRPBCC family protein n=1 Tax=Williamsia deligens TaxID=321325 RepID=A0ABW3G5P5_9NOCA|nr:SRPBCC family protein [Williamsia deligens]MCP2193437.1 Carbon monoxide dehydrogenase subunit G [Williamsia deligens]
MAARHEFEKVGPDYADAAPVRFDSTVEIDATPEVVFDVLVDAIALPKWAKVVRHARWTTGEPYGVDSERTVSMLAGLTGYEKFLVWDRGSRLVFRFDATSSSALSAFLEDYRLERTATGCRLTWVVAMAPRTAPAKLGVRAGRPVVAAMLQRFVDALPGVVASHGS